VIPPLLPIYNRARLAFERGEGAWLVTREGERYLDFAAGIAVTALGHCHPALVRALEAQGRRLWHTSNMFEIPNQQALAERLVALTFADTVFFTNSGTEAVECAIKMVRRHFHARGEARHRIITFEGAFHGRTMAAISAAGAPKLVEGFGPLLPGFDILPWGDHEALRSAIGPETAAIMIEPIQGEGGIRPLPVACLKGLRALCDEHGILLVLDEIQCGMGRTGRLFAHEQAGIAPDIMTIAKGIGGGFPLGACLATERAAAGMTAGSHGSTYGGNPLACAVGVAVMDEITRPGFLDGVARVAERLRRGLEDLVARHDAVFAAVRGEGLMLGLKCRPANTEVVRAGHRAGLLTVAGGDNVIRLLPPLTLTEDEADEGLRRLAQVAEALVAEGVA
jgi:acetylornithine/N-succinyldiaminopimelate aminotransferase